MMFGVVTTGAILEQLGEKGLEDVDYGHVDYALRKTGVEPLGRVGFARVFPQSAVEKVEGFIRGRRQKQPVAAS